MRFDQYRGLNEWARKTVMKRERAKVTGVMEFEDGRKKRFTRWAMIPVARKKVIGNLAGYYKPVVAQLHRYTLSDGRVLDEYVQATIHSSGPVYHIALKDARTGEPIPESLWTDEEFNDA